MITHTYDHDTAGRVVILTCPTCGKRVEWDRDQPSTGWHVVHPGNAATDPDVRHEWASGMVLHTPEVLA